MRAVASTAALTLLLVGCGGGDDESTTDDGGLVINQAMVPKSDAEAHRFLTQATFGPTPADIARVRQIGYDNWIDEQFAKRPMATHLAMVEASAKHRGRGEAWADDLRFSWWTLAVRDPAQLRRRVAFALSEIFVVSSQTLDNGRSVASYLDMLTDKADANYRSLLESVSMHPAMGQYLSHLGNLQSHPATGRVPDENFAREVMQLFSIGLYELNDAGRPVKKNGQYVETYTAEDIQGLARVFTGFSWYRPPAQASLPWGNCFYRTSSCNTKEQDVKPMSAYADVHEREAKAFLLQPGETFAVPRQDKANPQESLRIALNRLAGHRNTAPFISKQLIQRLVTSNPSDGYVSDITKAFRSSNGNIKSVVKAILLHPEARQPSTSALSGSYGKLREPLLRVTHLMRALKHTSDTYTATSAKIALPYYAPDNTSDPGTFLGQEPMRAPSVFNFFRPGYVPPQTKFAEAGLVAPEMQITSEASVLGYANFVAGALANGWGGWIVSTGRRDIQFDLSEWNTYVSRPADLVDQVSLRLLGRPLSTDIREQAISAITSMPDTGDFQRRRRIQAAILLVAVSPEFIIQQ